MNVDGVDLLVYYFLPIVYFHIVLVVYSAGITMVVVVSVGGCIVWAMYWLCCVFCRFVWFCTRLWYSSSFPPVMYCLL